jgi:MFS family permease
MGARVVFQLVGGVWGDRFPRVRLMVAMSLASGAIQIVTAVLLLTHRADLWQLAFLQAAAGAASSLFMPAARGLVPEAVSEPFLQQANALLRIGVNATQVGGAALGGGLVAAVGPGWAFAVDAASFFVSAAVIGRMRVGAGRGASRRFLDDLIEGWRAFAEREWLWAVVLSFSFIGAASVGAWSVLGPATAKAELGGASAWGAILAADAVGLVIGGVVALRVRIRRPLLVGQLLTVLLALPLVLLALPAPVVVIALGTGVGGAAIEVFSVFWETALQRHVPPAVLSRVGAWDALGSWIAIPLGAAAAGPLADTVGRRTTLLGAAAVVVAAALAALLSRDVRTLTADPVAV